MAAPAHAHRERAVDVLKRAYAEGRLELDEFEARAGRALATRSTLDLRLQLRGLLIAEARRGARRAVHVAAVAAVWLFLSFFLAVGCVVALFATDASAWTLAFPAAWVAVTWLALRDVRRAR
jgi:2-keto-3-deoxy-galactonokinase